MTVSFSYASMTWTFRAPILGNSQELTFQRVKRETRGGDLIIFRDNDWPKTEVLHLTFELLCEPDYRRMLAFLKATIGNFVLYQDHENRVWYGVVQNPEAEIVQTGRFSWRIDINFEGDLV